MKSSKDDKYYEYIVVYFGDLAICMKDPQAFCDTIKEKYKLKLKELDQSITILDVDIPEIKMEANQRKYVENNFESYEKMFGSKPKKTRTPLIAGEHPENDLSEFCDQAQIKQYQITNNSLTANLAFWIGEI